MSTPTPAATNAAKAGIGFGSALAITISWSVNKIDALGHRARLPVVDLRGLLCPETSVIDFGLRQHEWFERVVTEEKIYGAASPRSSPWCSASSF